MTNEWSTLLFLILPHIRLVPAQCGATNVVSTNVVSTNAVSTNVPLIGYLEQIFLFLRGKLGEMMTLFHTVAFCGHLWQCFKKMASLVHKLNICSFWLETLCQGQKNSEGNFCFPRHNVFQPKGYIFLGFHPLTYHKPLHFNGFCFILPLQILLISWPIGRPSMEWRGVQGGDPPAKAKRRLLR